jgi:hypothetical protein
MAPLSTSQNAYTTKAIRFENGVNLINAWLDYGPNNTKIKKATLLALVTTINNANALVDTTEEAMKKLQKARLLLCFTVREGPKDARGSRAIVNLDCLEERIIGVRNYISGEEFSEATLKIIERIVSKIHPQYPKKKEGEKEAPSPSEKSYASITGYGRQVITLITNLGASYSPPDANLSVAGMTTLLTAIEQKNKDLQTALDDYGTANRARKKLFGKQSGLAEVKPLIKSYLSSFEGHTRNDHYIEFNDALRGR